MRSTKSKTGNYDTHVRLFAENGTEALFSEYVKFCEEESHVPLSLSSFRRAKPWYVDLHNQVTTLHYIN